MLRAHIRSALVSVVLFGIALSAPERAGAQGAYARISFHRVPPGSEAEFERFMRDAWRPIIESERQGRRLSNWILYRVHLTGAADEYNYVSVSYHDTWATSDMGASWSAMVSERNPAGARAAIARTNELGPIVRQAFYGRVDFVAHQPPRAFRFAVMDFMKVRDGMIDQYLKVEREDWKPLHQVLTNDGNRVGWVLWDYMIPGGTGSPHDFMTAMLFTDYDQIKAADDAGAYRRAHPNGDLNASVARTRASRDVVRTEIWEVVDTLN
jgi:hypothetical protein